MSILAGSDQEQVQMFFSCGMTPVDPDVGVLCRHTRCTMTSGLTPAESRNRAVAERKGCVYGLLIYSDVDTS